MKLASAKFHILSRFAWKRFFLPGHPDKFRLHMKYAPQTGRVITQCGGNHQVAATFQLQVSQLCPEAGSVCRSWFLMFFCEFGLMAYGFFMLFHSHHSYLAFVCICLMGSGSSTWMTKILAIRMPVQTWPVSNTTVAVCSG